MTSSHTPPPKSSGWNLTWNRPSSPPAALQRRTYSPLLLRPRAAFLHHRLPPQAARGSISLVGLTVALARPERSMVITLQIGGYTIQAVEPCHHRTLFWPFEPFTSFLIPPVESPDLAFRITVTDRLPKLPKGRLLYDACHGLWKLYE